MTSSKLIDEIKSKDFNHIEFGLIPQDDFHYFKYFDLKGNNLNDTLDEVNHFLGNNGLDKLNFTEYHTDLPIKNNQVELLSHYNNDESKKQLVLLIDRRKFINPINDLLAKIIKFRDERDWDQFHNTKDLAIALNIESGELLQNFLWKSPADVTKDKIEEELADVLIFSLLLAHKMGFEIFQIVEKKLEINSIKYPVEKAKGNATKYNEFKS